jgi:hypothetical protein
MTLDEFWEHIHKSKRKDPHAHAERLTTRLAKLKPDEVIDFDHWWHLMMGEAYNWNLWGAAYLLNGGCSDDGFEYFRDWLILQGRDTFQAAVSNPDSLAALKLKMDEASCECYPASDAWFAATGTARDDAGYRAWGAATRAKYPKGEAYPELGEGWDFDDPDEMKKRYPELFKQHGWQEEP